MIQGALESVNAAGVAQGWLRDDAAASPPIVQIRENGRVLAEAVALDFRPDLLAAGVGHGHYGFAARLRAMPPPGPVVLDLFLPVHSQGVRARLTVPLIPAAAPVPVEALLHRPAAWSAEDLIRHTDCLGLGDALAAMGADRFVDVTYRFVLGRWASEAERGVDGATLTAGQISPGAFLRELLAGREYADRVAAGEAALPSPWDAAFPYSGPLARISA